MIFMFINLYVTIYIYIYICVNVCECKKQIFEWIVAKVMEIIKDIYIINSIFLIYQRLR